MFAVTYVSTATKDYVDADLEQILTESRTWNKGHQLTGLLLYKDKTFLQFIEGPKAAVLEILAKIRTDPRHHSMIVMLQQEQTEREFSDWFMGFQRLEGTIPEPLANFSDFWELPFTDEEFLTDPTRALALLRSFKQSLSLGSKTSLAHKRGPLTF